MDPVQVLFADLRSSDPSIRFSVLSRIEGMEWTPDQLNSFKSSIKAEQDPGTKFHMQKILAKVESAKAPPGKTGAGATPKGVSKIDEFEKLLKAEERDDLGIALILESVKRGDAPLAAMALREARWQEFSNDLLPFVLQFFKRYGSYEDGPRIEQLCRHPDPRILFSAVEALEKINPEGLKPLIVPLLASPVPGIRSRAVRLLHKWDTDEALRHVEAMLFSEDINERQAALFHAFFFPFTEIEPLMLRFLSIEGDLSLIQRAGLLFRANPNPDVLMGIVDIMEACREERRKVISDILAGVMKSLSQAGLIEKTPEEIMADLKIQYRNRKVAQLIERCITALSSNLVQHRKAAIAKLQELTNAGIPEARKILSEHIPKETDPELKGLLAGIFGPVQAAPEKTVEADFNTIPAERRAKFLSELDAASFQINKSGIFEYFPKALPEEKVFTVQLMGKFCEKTEVAPFLIASLDDPEPAVVAAAVEALQSLQPEALFPHLGKLVQHSSGDVRAVSVRAISLFDKKRAVELIEEMLLSVESDRRGLAIQSAAQLDFTSVRKVLLKTLEQEKDPHNLEQLRNVFKANFDKELLTDLIRLRSDQSSDPEKRGFMDALVQMCAKQLVQEGKTTYSQPSELITAIEQKLTKDQKARAEEKPSYSLDNIQKIRQKKAPAKSSDPIQVLSADLRSSDPSMRFSVLSRVESIEWTGERVAAFKVLSDKEKDPGTKFHMQKILAHITRDKGASGPVQNKQVELELLLKKSPRDDMSIALLMESVTRKESAGIGEILRKVDWKGFSNEVLPFILQFYKKYGKPEDLSHVEKLCHHQDSRVLAAAIEALEKINPESLKSQIVPLLVNPNQGIRSRAVRLLYRWDPKEAIKHLEAMLFSEDPSDRLAALFHAFFFSFPEIEPLLLKFLGVEDAPDVLEKAGFLFRANPAPEEPLRLIDVMETSAGEKRRLIGEILTGVVNSLSQAGLIQASPEQIMNDLQANYRKRKTADLIDRCSLALKSEDVQNRSNAVHRLSDLGKMGYPEANEILTKHLANEKDPGVKGAIENHLGVVKQVSAPVTVGFEKATGEQRLQILAGLTRESLAKIRAEISSFLPKGNVDEKLAIVQALGRAGGPGEASLVQGMLNDPESKILAATIETLRVLDPDVLFPYLPKLIQHVSEEVRIVAIRVFSMFDKKQALALVEKMMSAMQARQRGMAVFCSGQFDFPSVRDLLLKGLTKEQDLDNFRQIASILKANLDEEVYVGIVHAHKSVTGSRSDVLDELEKEAAGRLVGEKKVQYPTVKDLNDAVTKRLEEEEKRSKAAQPSYALSNIQNMRKQQQEQAVAPKIDPELVKFAAAAFSIGAVLTALIWFLILAPGDKTKGTKKKGPKVKTGSASSFSTEPADIQGKITFLDPDGLGIYVKPDPDSKQEFHVTFKTKPRKPYEKGKTFSGQVKPVKKYGDTIHAELLMTY